MLVSDFHFHLPEDLIAQQPPADRAGARMLAVDRVTGAWRDAIFRELPKLLRAGDVLVLNNSRVIPARLYAQRAMRKGDQGQEPSGKIEVLLTGQTDAWEWKALAKPGRKVQVGERLVFHPRTNLKAHRRTTVGPEAANTEAANSEAASAAESRSDTAPGSDRALPAEPSPETLTAEVIDRGDFGERTLRFTPTSRDFLAVLDDYGHIPLPPYIHREDDTSDRDRYQTVYAQTHGSVAVPTAGLHFTSEILDQLRSQGVQICYVTLHVGLGTFQPLRVERLDEIELHAERYSLPEETARLVNAARAEGRRVIAAGTTTVRTLEHCARIAGVPFAPQTQLPAKHDPVLAIDGLTAHSGTTSIFISPGFEFKVVNALLTNFHLPQSSLLMLVAAFAGSEILAAYQHAVAERYRFFSYGDCMFIS